MPREDRYKDLVPMERFRTHPVRVVGCGSVGRVVARTLAQMGAQTLILWDHDTVSEENLGTQGWAAADVGKPKVTALGAELRLLNPEEALRLSLYQQPFGVVGDDGFPVSATFLCVDNLDIRKQCYAYLMNMGPEAEPFFLVDGRVLGEVGRVVTVVGAANSEFVDFDYTTTLVPQSDAEEGRCTQRMTPYGAMVAAAFMVRQYVAWLRGHPVVPDVVFNLAEPMLGVNPGDV